MFWPRRTCRHIGTSSYVYYTPRAPAWMHLTISTRIHEQHTHTHIDTQLWIVKNIEMFLFFFSSLLFLLSAWIRPDCYTYRALSVLYLWQIDAFSSCVETSFFLGGGGFLFVSCFFFYLPLISISFFPFCFLVSFLRRPELARCWKCQHKFLLAVV